MWLRNHEIALGSAEAVLALAEEHGFQIWSAVGSCLRGAALVNTGGKDGELVLMERGIEAYQGLKTPPVFWPLLLHLCAGAYGAAARPEQALRLLNEAIAGNPRSAGPMVSEFLILKADLLLALSSDNAMNAESLYRNAVSGAQEAHAPMLELRAAMRLSRLWQNQGKDEQAKQLLGGAYSQFTEGFTTADLKEARAILITLSS
jgi:hypothetical protein